MQSKILSVFNLIIGFIAFWYFAQAISLVSSVAVLLVMGLVSGGIWMQKRLAYLVGAVLNLTGWIGFMSFFFFGNYFEEGWGAFYGMLFGIPTALLILPLSLLLFRLYLRSAKIS